jgi:7-cyano-7-deazaguanine synthase
VTRRRGPALALLSGGLDSTVAAAMAAADGGVAHAVTLDYGQRARESEMRAARAIAAALGATHQVIELPFLQAVTRTALVATDAELPEPERGQLDDARGARASMAAVWVPNRNGLFLAVAAAIAEASGLAHVVVGFNREEAATFPDNSEEFLARTNAALALSTRGQVTALAPTAALAKEEIVRIGYSIAAPMSYVWSCYRGDPRPCWRCESCQRLARALDANASRARFEAEWRSGE